MKQTENQFENEEVIEEEFPANFNDDATVAQSISKETPFAQGPQGQVYDYMSAPDMTKAPPFVDLNGETVKLLKAELIIPPKEAKWTESLKNKSIRYKPCKLTLFFDKENQQTNISGVTVFDREGAYSHPTINLAGKTQATDLLNKVAKFKNVDPKEIAIRDLMIFLNSKPMAKIIKKEFENPSTKKMVEKNMIDKFVN